MPPQNPVDRAIGDVSTLGVKRTYPDASLAVRPTRDHWMEATGRRARLWYVAWFMPPTTPERFGDYELVQRLGVGGMAETFVAIRRGPGGFEQRVCLKRILPTFVDEAEFVEMFLRAALRHLRRRGESLDPGLTSYIAHALGAALDFAHTADENGVAAGSIQSGALKGKVP